MADNKTQIVITAKDETRAAIASAQAGLQALTSSAAGLGLQLGALGGAASLGGLGLMAKQAIDAADNLGKMAQKVGVSVESLSALEYAGKLSDVSLEQLGAGLKKLSVNLNEVATNADGDAAAAFRAIGVSVKDAAGNLRSADDVFADVAEAFAGMKDGAGKTALAVQIFGKAGADLIPLLNAGAKGLAEMRGEAEALGLVFTGDMAKQAEAFNDNLTRLSESTRGFGNELAGIVLPTLSQLAQEFVNSAREGTGFASILGAGLKTGLETIAVLGANVVYVFKAIGNEIGGIAAQVAALSTGDFQGFKFIGESMKEEAAKARAELDKLEQRILNPQAPEAAATRAQSAAPIFGGGKEKSGKKEKELSAEDMAYGGYKGAYKEFTEAIKRVTADAEAAANAEVEIEKDKQDRIMAVVRETYDGKLAVLQNEMKAAAQLLDEGLINEDQWAEYANVRIAAFSKVKDEGTDAMKELQRAVEGWGKASADAFVEFAFTGKTSFSDMVQSILKDLAKMVVYQNVTKPLAAGISDNIGSGGFGAFFKGLFGGGGFKDVSGLAAGVPQYAQGTPYVPSDGLAFLHQGEAVIPAEFNQPGRSGGGSTSNVVVNVDASGSSVSGDKAEAAELGRRIESAVRSVLMVEQRPGGLLSGA